MRREDLEVGDVVEYRGGTRRVRIERFGQKDGRQVFDGTCVRDTDKHDATEAGDGSWGYVTQVERVL